MSMILSLLLLQAAATTPQGEEPKTAVPPSDKSKLVCKTITPTGSRLGGKRVCAPQSEWDRLASETQEGTQDMLKSTRTCGGEPCN